MNYTKTIFLKSVAELDTLPQALGIEVAFAGRSNAGKSSALNTITGIRSLAKTSKTPGRTQLINLFTLGEPEDNNFLVDLPGYGYAKVSAAIKKRWEELLNKYIATRQHLKGIMLIIDIRHPLMPNDLQMINWCTYHKHNIHILLTKADKLTKNHANKAFFNTESNLAKHGDLISIQKFSAVTKEGLEEAHKKLDEWFGINLDD